jgi:hypothetical protein
MDPYLEQHWLDVHAALITYSRDQLQEQLPRELRARMEERVFVEPDDMDEIHGYYPDVRVIERPSSRRGNGQGASAATTLAEPVLLPLVDADLKQGFIEISDASSGNRIITVIEFLSPTNKVPGEGQAKYLAKQMDLKRSTTNFVEIDLTRRGHRQLMIPPSKIPRRLRTTFQACVRRAANPTHVALYPIALQSPLPKIAIPLRKKDADVSLDLQTLIEQCYKNGRYDDLDYSVPPNPPLAGADAKWAAAWLKKHARN